MNEFIESKIVEFIKIITKEYDKGINFDYFCSEEDDIYIIRHDFKDFYIEDFKEVIGRNIVKCFYDNDIYNISVYYGSKIGNDFRKFYIQSLRKVNHCIKKLQFLSLETYEVNNNKAYSLKDHYTFKTINKGFYIKTPKEKIILSNKIKINVNIVNDYMEVPAA